MSDLFEQWKSRPPPGSRPSESAPAPPYKPPAPPQAPPQYSKEPISSSNKNANNPFSKQTNPQQIVGGNSKNPFQRSDPQSQSPVSPAKNTTVVKPEDLSIFGLERYPIDGASMIVVGNSVMVLALPQCQILRWRVNRDQPPEQIEIIKPTSKGQESIYKLFLDPHGNHLIICLNNSDVYYLHLRSGKPKKLSNWKNILQGCMIETCAFDSAHVSESSTRAILLGTNNGRIYETSIDSSGKSTIPYLHYTLESNLRICSLHVTSVGGQGGSSNHDGNTDHDIHDNMDSLNASTTGGGGRLFVMCATDVPTRLYSFLGGPRYIDLFKAVVSNQTSSMSSNSSWSFTELGALDPNSGPRAELHCYERNMSAPTTTSSASGGTLFALLTHHGIYHGKLRVLGSSSANQVPSEAIVEPGLLPYDQGTPISIGATEYHFILLYPSSVVFMSRLSGSVVQELPLSGLNAISAGGVEMGLVRDETTKAIWLYSGRGIWKLNVRDEDRDVWLLSLEKGLRGNVSKFDDALRHAHTSAQKGIVLTKQALFHFDRQEYDRAARCFARASAEGDDNGTSFEEVALKFLDSGQSATLELFLEEKLRLLDPTEEKMQVTMLCTWLLELYLARSINDESSMAISDLESKVSDFLEEHSQSLDQDTTFQLLSSHGHAEALIKYASEIEDSVSKYNRIAAHHAATGNNQALLRVLDLAPFEKVKELFYKYSSLLLESIPGPTVVVWKRKPLNPAKLIPALVKYTHQRELEQAKTLQKSSKAKHVSSTVIEDRHYAIEYLEHCISAREPNQGLDPEEENAQLRAMYNYLLLLHARQPKSHSLLAFLDNHLDSSILDLEYALRVCKTNKQPVACVRLCAAMKLYEDAVDMAIKVDLDLAKSIANAVTETDGGDVLKRKLWMKIAEHCVRTIGLSDPKAALVILDEVPKSSALVMKSSTNGSGRSERAPLISVEDVLPFFEDLVTIDDFKDRIVASLERYDVTIEKLKKDMDEFTANAKEIHADIATLQQRKLEVAPNTLCALSGLNLTPGPYYIFPSGFAYRLDALIDHLLPHLPKHKQLRVVELCYLLTQSLFRKTLMFIKRNKLNPTNKYIPSSSSSLSSSTTHHHQGSTAAIGGGNDGSNHGLNLTSQSKDHPQHKHSTPPPLSTLDRKAYQTQLDDIVASECPLTGYIAIALVDEPLLSVEDFEAERSGWEI